MIDGHVHIIGRGAGGTGCWIRRRGFQRLIAPLLLREYGLFLIVLIGLLAACRSSPLLVPPLRSNPIP